MIEPSVTDLVLVPNSQALLLQPHEEGFKNLTSLSVAGRMVRIGSHLFGAFQTVTGVDTNLGSSEQSINSLCSMLRKFESQLEKLNISRM